MSRIPILAGIESWYCPNCKFEETIPTVREPHTRMHVCPKFAYLTTPLVRSGTKAKVERHYREDYVGRELVRLDAERRPVMNVITTRDDGQDCTVYAPTAQLSIRAE